MWRHYALVTFQIELRGLNHSCPSLHFLQIFINFFVPSVQAKVHCGTGHAWKSAIKFIQPFIFPRFRTTKSLFAFFHHRLLAILFQYPFPPPSLSLLITSPSFSSSGTTPIPLRTQCQFQFKGCFLLENDLGHFFRFSIPPGLHTKIINEFSNSNKLLPVPPIWIKKNDSKNVIVIFCSVA